VSPPGASVSPARPFDPAAARAALDALTPKLVDCKIAKEHSGRIKLTFSPNGSVSSAEVLAPFTGKPEGACIVSHLKKAHVHPFDGRPFPFVYTFVVPHPSPQQRK
jgi:hypothetical protein